MTVSVPSSFEIIDPEGMHPAPNYHHAIRAGNTLYMAGQVAFNEAGEVVAPGDVAGQAEQIMENIGKILKAAGADWGNIVKMTTYVVDRADSPVAAKIRLKALGGHRPPHTGVVVAALGNPDFKLEIEAIAVLED